MQHYGAHALNTGQLRSHQDLYVLPRWSGVQQALGSASSWRTPRDAAERHERGAAFLRARRAAAASPAAFAADHILYAVRR